VNLVLGSGTGRRAWRAVAVAVVTTVALSGCGDRNAAHGDPDPGGRRLHALESVRAAIPADAKVAFDHAVEPRWDSCDGRAGTFGWDDVVVDAEFSSRQSVRALSAHVAGVLRRAGWAVTNASGTVGATMQLPSGVTAQAMLTKDGSLFDLYAHLVPIGQRASGC
jgi:hypothetical protein